MICLGGSPRVSPQSLICMKQAGVLNGPANGPPDLEVLGLKVKYKQARHGKELMRGGEAHGVQQETPGPELGKVAQTCHLST